MRLLVGESRDNQQNVPASLLGDIQKQFQAAHPVLGRDSLQSNGEGVRLDAFCQKRLENHGRAQDRISGLAIVSAGSISVLAIVEHEIWAEVGAEVDNARPQEPGIRGVKDLTSIMVFEGLIRSTLDRPYFTGLNGCLRVDITIDNAAANITDVQIDLMPQIFSPRDSLDDFIIRQAPGGHEALLCLLLTQHQQKAETLTAKQAHIQAGFDAISTDSASSFDRIAHVSVMRSLAFQLPWTGTVLDVGCGQGVFGGLVASYYRKGDTELYGFDLSEAMIKAPHIQKHYQLPIRTGPMEQVLVECPAPDHIACFSVLQYVTPMTFMAVLPQMFRKARKSVTFDIPEITSEYARLLENVPELARPTDHLRSLERIGTPPGWRIRTWRYCLSYTEPNYEMDVYSRYIRYERVE